MPVATVSSRMLASIEELRALTALGMRVVQTGLPPDACDFVTGNPQEMPIPGMVEALVRHAQPKDARSLGYMRYEPVARAAVAASLTAARGRPYEAADIAITAGGFGALASAMLAVLEVGEEVIYPRPGWFNYAALIRGSAGIPVPVDVVPETFDLDLPAIQAAITARTRIVLVNTPHNPTGRIYPRAQLDALARLLEGESARRGQVIWLLADEAFARIVFDDHAHISPAESYAHTLIAYSYGKTLLAPGERLGWLAASPAMPEADRALLRQAVPMAQVSLGYGFAGRGIQRALPDLETLCVDIAALQRRRDRMIAAMRAAGYDVPVPEGTFYLIPRSPVPDDSVFAARLAEQGVWVMPGSLCELPGRLRISLTANDDMVERALPVFARTIAEVRAQTV